MIDKQRLRTFLLGGAVGALAGILLAPRSGRELRSNITNRAEEARERGRETYFETSERLQERLAETREGSFRSPGPEPKASVGSDIASEEPPTFTERPKLREVSSEGYEEEQSDAKPDELRRKVQETRARLRERLEGPEQSGPKKDQDE